MTGKNCFNPYFTGSISKTPKPQHTIGYLSRFNPYFTGSISKTYF